MKHEDYMLLTSIDRTTSSVGPSRKRRSNAPSILRSLAIIAIALVILVMGFR